MYYAYKLTDQESGHYFYFLCHVKDIDLVAEQIEHTSANSDNELTYQFLNQRDWDQINIEPTTEVKTSDILNGVIPTNDSRCMNISDSFKSLIIQPKQKEKKKREPKPKAEPKKPAKPRGKKLVLQLT